MGYVLAAMLIVLGGLAASGAILAKKPELKPTLDKLAQNEGYIGVVGAIWGLWMVINAILNISPVLTNAPLWWITWMASAVVLLALGFLSGFPLITQFAAKTEEAKKKAGELRDKLLTVKNPLGFAGIGIGVWCIVAQIM